MSLYSRVNWKDYPETDTPITAENLNKMDEGIYNNSVNIGDMDKIADESDGTVCGNVEEIRNGVEGIKVYVGTTDKKLHFVDFDGADTVLPFSSIPTKGTAVKGYGTGAYGAAKVGKLYVATWANRHYNEYFQAYFSGMNSLVRDYNPFINSLGEYCTYGFQVGVATSTTISSNNEPYTLYELS